MLKKLVALVLMLASPAAAQEKRFTLQVPDAIADTGFLKHLLPRFSLKTGVRITQVDDGAEAVFGTEGEPVFAQGDVTWHLALTPGPYTKAFRDWLVSDVGKRTIEAYAPDGAAVFSSDVRRTAQVQSEAPSGDVVMGAQISLEKCGRCHVVGDVNRMKAIGSTPSFALMRTFGDWQERFETFFLLRPHPAFTQVAEVTEPFADNLPSPIAPIEVTLEQIEAITAYVGSIAPADLGAPIQSQ